MNIFNLICAINVNTVEMNFLWSSNQFHKLFSHASYVSVLFLLIELQPFKVSHPRSKTYTFNELIMGVHKENGSYLSCFLS